MGVMKRLWIVLGIVLVPMLLGLLFTYDVIKIEWVSFMAIQSSFKPQRDPLPVPAASVPVQGVAYIAELGAPSNPVAADKASLTRGQQYYTNTCAICHGNSGNGKSVIANSFLQKNPPTNLLQGAPLTMSDGEIFMTITNGFQGIMPQLRENLPDAQMRWDVVNYVRSLQQKAKK
jgi:mono/diheme cytochrome c family protein